MRNHVYTWVERGTVRLKCFDYEHKKNDSEPINPESSALTIRPPRFRMSNAKIRIFFFFFFFFAVKAYTTHVQLCQLFQAPTSVPTFINSYYDTNPVVSFLDENNNYMDDWCLGYLLQGMCYRCMNKPKEAMESLLNALNRSVTVQASSCLMISRFPQNILLCSRGLAKKKRGTEKWL